MLYEIMEISKSFFDVLGRNLTLNVLNPSIALSILGGLSKFEITGFTIIYLVIIRLNCQEFSTD